MRTSSSTPTAPTVHSDKEPPMRTIKRRMQALETTTRLRAPVYAIYLADAAVYQLVMGAPPGQLPAALFWERYPTAQIVSSLGAAALWDAL
jgi:hypothetical protein